MDSSGEPRTPSFAVEFGVDLLVDWVVLLWVSRNMSPKQEVHENLQGDPLADLQYKPLGHPFAETPFLVELGSLHADSPQRQSVPEQCFWF